MVTKQIYQEAYDFMMEDLPKFLYTGLQRQRKFIITRQMEKRPCPNCKKGVNNFDAAPSDWNGKDSLPDDSFQCPYCETKLKYNLMFFGGGQPWTIR